MWPLYIYHKGSSSRSHISRPCGNIYIALSLIAVSPMTSSQICFLPRTNIIIIYSIAYYVQVWFCPKDINSTVTCKHIAVDDNKINNNKPKILSAISIKWTSNDRSKVLYSFHCSSTWILRNAINIIKPLNEISVRFLNVL